LTNLLARSRPVRELHLACSAISPSLSNLHVPYPTCSKMVCSHAHSAS
jgi:hypothetical protein